MAARRDVVWGMGGDTGWSRVLPASGLGGLALEGPWRRMGDTIAVESPGGTAWLRLGAEDWADYEIAVKIRPTGGGNVQIPIRVSPDGSRRYLVDLLLGWKAIAVSRVDASPGGGGLLKLSVVNADLERGREIDLEIAVRGASITTYIEGALMNQVTDAAYPRGTAALSVWQASAEFRDLRIRRLA